jgi:hypothetical protein
MGQKQTRGAVYNLANLNQGLLAGINSRVQLYDWIGKEDGKWTLEPVCSHSGQVLALYFDVRGDNILVGMFINIFIPNAQNYPFGDKLRFAYRGYDEVCSALGF